MLKKHITLLISLIFLLFAGAASANENSILSFSSYIGITQYFKNFHFDDNEEEDEISPNYQVITGPYYEPENHPSVKLQLGYSYTDILAQENIGNDLNKKLRLEQNSHTIGGFLRLNF